jgi:hypothetical protein
MFCAGLFFLLTVSYENDKNCLSHTMLNTQAKISKKKQRGGKQTKAK